MTYEAVAQALSEAKTVTLVTHMNPDGDGLAACCALRLALIERGVTVRFACPTGAPSFYGFLPGFETMEVIADEDTARAQEPVDVVLSGDCGDLARLGACVALPRKTLINLDHHASNDRFGDLNIVDLEAESTGVVVAGVLKAMGVALTAPIAECLYTTIVYDTGRFMHSNTTAHTFRFAAKLLETGIDAAEINRKLTYTKKPKDMEVLRTALEHLVVDEAEPRLAGIAIGAEAIDALGEVEDWGDTVDIPRSMVGIEVAYFLRESPDKQSVRVSLRSNPPYRIGPVAESYGGGGHLLAAGATAEGSLDQVLPEFLAKLRAVLQG